MGGHSLPLDYSEDLPHRLSMCLSAEQLWLTPSYFVMVKLKISERKYLLLNQALENKEKGNTL